MPRRRPIRTAAPRHLAAACLIAITTPTLNAHEPAPWSAIAPLEQRVDIAVLIDGAAEQLASPPGRALSNFITESGLFDGTIAASADLARALRADNAEISKRLLSNRVTILIDIDDRKPAFPGTLVPGARWALLTEVDEPTERWVRSRLKAAPRDTLPGATVLALEDGRFRMAVTDAAPRRTHLVFAPDAADDLFKLAVEHARTTANPAHATLPPGDIIGFATLEDAVGQPASVRFSARITDTGWHANLLVHEPHDDTPCQGLDANAFAALARGSVASITTADPTAFTQLLTGTPVRIESKGIPASISGPVTLSLFANPDHASAPFSAQLVARVTDDDRALERTDALVSAYLVPFLPDAGAPAPSFEGRFPTAVRTQPITIRADILARWLGESPQVAWRYAGEPPTAHLALACAPPDRATDLANRAARVLAARPSAPLAFGLALRPADLARAISPEPTAPTAALRWLRELQILIHAPDPTGTARGELTLTTAP